MIASPAVYTGISTTMTGGPIDLALLNTGSAISIDATPTRDTESEVNVKEFRVATRMLGFLVGLLIMAADLSGQAFILPMEQRPSPLQLVMFSIFWSTLTSLVACSAFVLLCRLVEMTLHPRDAELMKVLGTQGPVWSVAGVTIGYALADACFIPPRRWWCSLAIILTFIGMLKIVVVILSRSCTKVQKHPPGVQNVHHGREPSMIL